MGGPSRPHDGGGGCTQTELSTRDHDPFAVQLVAAPDMAPLFYNQPQPIGVPDKQKAPPPRDGALWLPGRTPDGGGPLATS